MSRRVILATLITPLALAAASSCSRPAPVAPADLVLRNGRIVTMDSVRAEAQAVAIAGHEIVAVGSDADIEAHVGEGTRVVDLGGRLAVPGFIEGHGHFMSLGEAKLILDLTAAASWDDIVAMVGAAARDVRPGAWITGRGWHQEKWTTAPAQMVDGVPLHHDLSRVSPDNPVLLEHASGHAAFANARAMELAGIDARTPNPAGGEIIRDAQGQPTGLLRETAQRLVSAKLEESRAARAPDEIEAEARRMVELAGQEALSKGVTSFHDAGASFADIDFFRRLEQEGALPIRLYAMVRRESNAAMAEKLAQYRMVAEGNDFLTVRSIKRQIDGALGSHGAWLLAPYEDLTTSSGLTLETPEDIEATARLAIEHGYQLNTHAIGDRANRVVLDIYERVFREHPDRTGLRWRIEHAQHLDPADIPRFASLGVIAAMQGVHATSDGPWVPRRIGEDRARTGAYVWRSLTDAGVVIGNGTDVPVEDIDPIASFYATVTRKTATGDVFFGEQRLTREEALRTYTLNNAIAAFEEELKGSIAPGKLADIVVLSQDILTVPEDRIRETKVDLTILGGQVKYERSPAVAGR